MTSRKKIKSTFEQKEAAKDLAREIGYAPENVHDIAEIIAPFLARRDVARDAEWKEATLDHRRVLVVWRETGMPSYTDLAMEIERLDALLASPSPASSEPPHDPDCTHPVGGCVRKPWKRKP